jgi:FkbM family methyltransferase
VRNEISVTVDLLGAPADFIGSADDPYVQRLDENAAALSGLAAFASTHLKRNAYALDVGANIGLSSVTLARLVGKVRSFEPSPHNAGFLQRNLQLNGVRNVEVTQAAVSDAPGVLTFHEAQFGAGSHVMSPGDLSRGAPSIEVPCLTLDSLDLPRVDFMKIDVEGHEPEVLAGARRLLERDRPLIFTELNLWCLMAYADHQPGAFIRRLWERFEVWAPEEDGTLTPIPHALPFLHDLIVRRAGGADVVLRPLEGIEMPDLPELAWPEAARQRLFAAAL